jgi:hypothetical protein
MSPSDHPCELRCDRSVSSETALYASCGTVETPQRWAAGRMLVARTSVRDLLLRANLLFVPPPPPGLPYSAVETPAGALFGAEGYLPTVFLRPRRAV